MSFLNEDKSGNLTESMMVVPKAFMDFVSGKSAIILGCSDQSSFSRSNQSGPSHHKLLIFSLLAVVPLDKISGIFTVHDAILLAR